jgi:hypothetical protein
MIYMQKKLDRYMGCGLFSGQPATNRESPATTPVSIVVFFRPEFKGVSGSVPNILNKDAARLSLFVAPRNCSGNPYKGDNYHA